MTAGFPIQQLTMVGDPDFFLCMRGKFVALELKDVNGKVRALQEHKLNEVRRTGGIALVADKTNWNEIKQTLKQLDQGEKWK